MQNIDISEILKNGAQYQGKHVTVAGWVRTARDSKTMPFWHSTTARRSNICKSS